MAKEKKISVILPPGVARFPNLWVPRRFEQPGKKPGDPKYDIGVVYEPAAMKKVEAIYKDAWSKFADSKLDDEELADYLAAFKSPFKRDKKDKTIKYLSAHSSAKYKPPVFDSKNRKVTKEFGGGSVIVLDVSIVPYDGFGGGMTSYINAVQLREFVAGGGFTGPKFETVDDGYDADDDEDEQSVGDNTTSPFAAEGSEDAEDHNF